MVLSLEFPLRNWHSDLTHLGAVRLKGGSARVANLPGTRARAFAVRGRGALAGEHSSQFAGGRQRLWQARPPAVSYAPVVSPFGEIEKVTGG